MKRDSKYVGNVYGCFWECVSCQRPEGKRCNYYTLRNVRSGMEVTVVGSQMLKIADGSATVSHLLHARIRKENGRRGFAFPKGGRRKDGKIHD